MFTPTPLFRARQFVVRPLTDVARRNASWLAAAPAKVEELNSRTPGWVVSLEATAVSPQEDWNAVRAWVGPGYQVLPVLRLDKGSDRYPTGTLVVRFKAVPDEEALHSFMGLHDLVMVKKTSWVTSQFQFNPAHPEEVFLPDVASRIQDQPCVEHAWLDAESPFVRLVR